MSSLPIAQFKYTGTALPLSTNVYVLFDTTVAFPGKKGLAAAGIETFVLHVYASQAGTVKAYKSKDRGVTWVQAAADVAVSATTASSTSYDVAPLEDFKLEWTNTVNQTVFEVDMAGSADG